MKYEDLKLLAKQGRLIFTKTEGNIYTFRGMHK